MSEGLIIALIGLLAAPMVVFVTWILNRKRNVADIHGVIATSAHDAVETMRMVMDTNTQELNEALHKIDMLIAENIKMQNEINELRKQNLLLLEENHILHSKIDALIAQAAALGNADPA